LVKVFDKSEFQKEKNNYSLSDEVIDKDELDLEEE